MVFRVRGFAPTAPAELLPHVQPRVASFGEGEIPIYEVKKTAFGQDVIRLYIPTPWPTSSTKRSPIPFMIDTCPTEASMMRDGYTACVDTPRIVPITPN